MQIRKSLYRVFSHDVTAAMFVFSPLGNESLSWGRISYCYKTQTWTLYTSGLFLSKSNERGFLRMTFKALKRVTENESLLLKTDS